MWCNVLYLNADEVAGSELAVDGEIEHRQVAGSSLDLQLRPDRPYVLGAEWWLRPGKLALVPGRALRRGST
jgi:hypothetical protein